LAPPKKYDFQLLKVDDEGHAFDLSIGGMERSVRHHAPWRLIWSRCEFCELSEMLAMRQRRTGKISHSIQAGTTNPTIESPP